MKLSVVIPAHNEEGNIEGTVTNLIHSLEIENIPFEIIVVNDNSSDTTSIILEKLSKADNRIVPINNQGPNGFGHAVRCGLQHYNGECVAIVMADLSDDPDDLVKFYRMMIERKVDCVFGSRFIKGGSTIGYPGFKKIVNRLANNIIRILFAMRYNDTTNAFKLYKKETIEGLRPFLSPHFNLTIELPLKAIIRGYTYEVLPNSWTNRKSGESKLLLSEMGSRYFFILLYCLIEKYFSKGDFRKKW